MGRRRLDITNKRFGRLIALADVGSKPPGRHHRWLCQCDCGKTTVVQINNLNNGHTSSCGCLEQENLISQHGNEDRIQAIRETWSDPQIRFKVSGEKNPRWRGGLSYGKYCHRFNEDLKEEIRDKFNRQCYICGVSETKPRLHVHHIDYNKVQGCKGMKWSLLPLCQSCHAKTNNNRWYWFNRLINYWVEPYIL
jgi:hypothetical protein